MLSDPFHSLRDLENISWHNDIVIYSFEDVNNTVVVQGGDTDILCLIKIFLQAVQLLGPSF